MAHSRHRGRSRTAAMAAIAEIPFRKHLNKFLPLAQKGKKMLHALCNGLCKVVDMGPAHPDDQRDRLRPPK